jgi:hypothetical protein
MVFACLLHDIANSAFIRSAHGGGGFFKLRGEVAG